MEAYGLVGDESPKIIKALLNSSYTWRYVSGISKETGVSREKANETLDWLMKNGLAKSSQGATGRIWALTEKGRTVFAGLS
jgi:predicted transcriptional regulator